AIDRPGDLDAAVEDVLGQRRHGPVALADMRRFGQEIGLLAGIEPLLALDPKSQQFLAAAVELAMQVGDERDCLFGEHLFETRIDLAVDKNARRKVQSRHFFFFLTLRKHCARAIYSLEALPGKAVRGIMDAAFVADWLNLVLRWAHMIVGIA